MTKTPDILIGLPHLGNSALLARAKALNAHVLISANGLSRWRKTSGLREWAGWKLADQWAADIRHNQQQGMAS